MWHSIFIYYLTLYRPLGYLLVFVGVMFEGDLFLLITASLVRLHYFDIIDMFTIVYAGVFIGDMGWFYLGRKASTTSNRFFTWLVSHTKRLPVRTENKFLTKLLISKFMYGTHRPFLFTLGTQGMEFKKLIPYQLTAIFIWILVIGAVGYAFGALLTTARHTLRYVEVGLFILVIGYLIAMQLMKRFQERHHILEE